MTAKLSQFKDIPELDLAKSLYEFSVKKNKNSFEELFLVPNIDVSAKDLLNGVFGDYEMRNANFKKALGYYGAIDNPTSVDSKWISKFIIGHNKKEHFNTAPNQSMEMIFEEDFSFLKASKNKLSLAKKMIKLNEVAMGADNRAAKANQLIGNVLYNTSKLGYFRHLFVRDEDNTRCSKYNFVPTRSKHMYFYKDIWMSQFINIDKTKPMMEYYKRALSLTTDKEQKARVIFQLASVENLFFH